MEVNVVDISLQMVNVVIFDFFSGNRINDDLLVGFLESFILSLIFLLSLLFELFIDVEVVNLKIIEWILELIGSDVVILRLLIFDL